MFVPRQFMKPEKENSYKCVFLGIILFFFLSQSFIEM